MVPDRAPAPTLRQRSGGRRGRAGVRSHLPSGSVTCPFFMQVIILISACSITHYARTFGFVVRNTLCMIYTYSVGFGITRASRQLGPTALGNTPAHMRRKPAHRPVDILGRDACLRRRRLDVLARDGLAWVEVRGCAINKKYLEEIKNIRWTVKLRTKNAKWQVAIISLRLSPKKSEVVV